MKDDRDIVLERIREALKSPRIHHASHGHAPQAEARHDHFEEWLPAVGPSSADWTRQFAEQSEALRTEFIETSMANLPDTVKSLKRTHGWNSFGYHTTDLTRPAIEALGGNGVCTDGAYDAVELEKCDVGITGCDCLVAQTGSVLVSTRSAGGRTLSILPPHHVVIAKKDQLLPDLPAAIELIKKRYGSDLPSMLCFVSGPSRTGDIERILVLGAHGPKKLTVLLISDDAGN